LLRRIEKYLKRSGTPATRFGREAVHDPRFVTDLRNGREPRRATTMRVHHFLDSREGGQ
jgi:2,4-dienoyl-CoA reductase-like NADH-dependent reductase (Old Yellow Enzyme family)